MDRVRIGASRVADGIDLIDVFREAGFESGLAVAHVGERSYLVARPVAALVA